ncbi:MAG: hypothetical protein JW731_08510, partial [Bacteroidales bacterium]|nr:hypothetical protein [Bacteroidales bacterium]
MKKFYFLCVLAAFTLYLQAENISYSWTIDEPEIFTTGDFQRISFEGSYLTGITGEPTLPYFAVKLLIPPGEAATSIEFIGEGEVTIQGTYMIFPQQPSRPLSEGNSGEFHINNEVYQSNFKYPAKQTGELTTQYLNGFAIAMSTFTPVRFNPVTGELSYYKEVKINITTTSDQKSVLAIQNLHSGQVVLNRLQKFVQNKDMIDVYPNPGKDQTEYQLLIVTTQAYASGFQDLIDIYLERGIKTQVVTKELIQSTVSGQDTQEKIRNYIIQEYQDNGIEYVLLGGDVELIPYRGFYCYVQSGSGYTDDDIPADLYYSALDGNWNTDGDGYWGEPGEDDLLSEISVARFPFSNATELANLIHKSVYYQNFPVLGEFNKATMAGEWLYSSPDTYGSDYLELLIGHSTENGYETWGIPEDYTFYKLYEENSSWAATQIKAEINAGRQFIHHVGHANSTYVAYLYNSDITDANFSGANGITHNYTILQTHGCICGSFDYSDCILEKMVNIQNFAVAVIGNSRYGWFNEGQSEGPAAHLHREMMDALYHEKMNCIGQAFSESKIQTAPWVTAPGQWEEGALRWNFYDINILGDPALSVWTDEPISIQTSYQSTIPLGAPSTSVTVTSGGEPLEDFSCAILKDGVLCGMGYTNSAGTALVTFDPVFTETGVAELVVSGYNCLPVSYPVEVIPNEGAYVIYSSHTINDSQENNNGLADYGETIGLSIEIENIGTVQAENVTVTLTSADGNITLTDNSENYGNIPAGSSQNITNGFSLEIADDIPDQHIVNFEIEVSANDKALWNSNFSITVNAPSLFVGYIMIDDAVGGNGNGILDPGENVTIYVETNNEGHSPTPETSASLSCSNPYVGILNSPINLGIIDANSAQQAAFEIQIAPGATAGSAAAFNFTATGGNYSTNVPFSEVIGKIPVLVVDLDENHSSGPAILTAIQNNGVTAEYVTSLPADLSLYSSLFICVGIYSNNYVIGSTEGATISNFINAGGKVYLEGGDVWYYDPTISGYNFDPLFGINPTADGSGDMATLQGLSGTFTAGMSFIYNGENNWMDHIEAISPAFKIFQNSSPSYGAAVAYDQGTYRTIGVNFEFGGLVNGSSPSTKDELMFEYLFFFGLIPPPAPP